MDEVQPYTSETKQVHDVHMRNISDVQRDVEFIMEHLNDPNFDLSRLPSSISVLEEEPTERYVGDDGGGSIDFDNKSPYPEVRAAVSNVDDPLMPVNTFRMWFLGILFSVLTSGLTQVLCMRYPSLFVSSVIAQFLCFPLGRGLAVILPTKRFNTFGHIWSLNPGPFSIKEHVCITVMVNISYGQVYATYVVLTQRVLYGQTIPMVFQILLAIGSQCIGFCVGGLLRQFVVWPSSMIWPGVLVDCVFFNTLHNNYNKANQGHMTRNKFFWIAMAGSFIWYWIPGYLFTALSMFNWLCWITPNNVVINILFGTNSGLGMSVLTFDWAMISSLVNPLTTPWWSQMNIGVAFLLIFWLIGPILYFTNAWNSAYLPIFARIPFDNTGSPYVAQRIITNGIFDPVKYTAYSTLFLPTTIALTIGAAFITFPAIFMHIFLWYRKDIVRRFRNSLKDEHDIHSRLMQNYPEVPTWWYGTIGIICFAFLCIAIKIVPTQLPIWAAVIAMLISFILSVPLSMILAITNQKVTTPMIYDLIAGYMLPGRPIANTIFKTVGYVTSCRASEFAAGLKLGHYMKVPPRIMFIAQIVPTVITSIWVTFIQDWMLNNIEDICTPRQKHAFICPQATVFSTESVIFGAVGPQRLFSPGAPYSSLLWFFPIGFLLPIPFYLLAHRFPLSIWRYINIPAAFGILAFMPQFSGINYSSGILCSFIFNYVIRRFHLKWWMRYNYILATALDVGTVISMTTIFFTLTVPTTGGITLNWWGNTVWKNTADAKGVQLKPLPESGFIGPQTWS